VHIFTFLATQYDPNHKPNPDLVEHVTTTMVRLRYPFAISKGALQAVGNPLSWPNLLAVLAWMVDLLEYDQAANEDTDEFSNEDDTEKFMFGYLAGAYGGFMSDAYDEEAQDLELEERFELRNESCTKGIEQLDEQNAALREEIEQLKAEQDGFRAQEAKRHEMQKDAEKYEKFIEKQTAHIASLKQQLKEKQVEAEETQDELEQAQHEKEECRQQVAEQVMSVGDVQRLQHDKATMDENLQRTQDEKEAMETELWDTEMLVKTQTDELEESAKLYQKKAEELKIAPVSAKNADGVDVSLKFNRLASNVEDMVDKDLKHDIKPRLGEFKIKLVAKYHTVDDDKLAATEKMYAIESKMTDHRDAIAQCSETLARAETSLEHEKELWTEKKRAVTKEIDQVEGRVHLLKTADESTLAESQRKLDDISTQFQVTKQQFETEKNMMNEALLALTFDLTDHRDYIQQNLKVMSDKADDVLREVELLDEEEDDADAEDTGRSYAE
jgi:kinetochore protein NDC80